MSDRSVPETGESDQQRFENKAREAARTLEQGALDLATAAALAENLGDTFALRWSSYAPRVAVSSNRAY